MTNRPKTFVLPCAQCAYVTRNKDTLFVDTLLAQLFTGIAELEPTGKLVVGGGVFVSTVLMPKERDPLRLFGHQAYITFFRARI
jgi:hypothetical protein